MNTQETDMRVSRARRIAAIAGMLVLGVMAPCNAAPPTDGAAIQIDVLDHALVSVARARTIQERINILTPTVTQTFNVAVMARFVIGAPLDQMSRADQDTITASFFRYMTARLAHEFASFAHGTITIDPLVQSRGADKVVRTTIVDGAEPPDRLDYRMRQYDGVWRVIDIYYNGVSELTTQRADLAATIAAGRASAIVTRIDASTSRLSR